MENLKYDEPTWRKMSFEMGDGLDRIVGWGEVNENQRKNVRDIFETAKPRSMLEIGFNRGASALTWLLGGIDFLYSVDVDGSLNSVNYLKSKFNIENQKRFEFKRINSFNLKYEDLNQNFDLVFIDGDHSYQGAFNDTQKALLFNPKYLLYDDYFHPGHQTDIQNAILNFPNLSLIKEYKDSPGLGLFKVNQ